MCQEDSTNPFFDPQDETNFNRGHLPHMHQEIKYQFLTFRLYDSLPQSLLEDLKKEKETFYKLNPEPWQTETKIRYINIFGTKLEYYFDQSFGSCILRNKDYRKILSEAILYFDGQRCKIDSFVIMPNHVHVLLIPKEGYTAEQIVGSIKQYAGNRINKLIGRRGRLWMRENFDRLVRSEDNLKYYRHYILHNPKQIKKGDFTLYYCGKIMDE